MKYFDIELLEKNVLMSHNKSMMVHFPPNGTCTIDKNKKLLVSTLHGKLEKMNLCISEELSERTLW